MLRADDEERERLIRERKDLMAQSRAAAMEAMARRQTVRARVAALPCLFGAVAMRAVLTESGRRVGGRGGGGAAARGAGAPAQGTLAGRRHGRAVTRALRAHRLARRKRPGGCRPRASWQRYAAAVCVPQCVTLARRVQEVASAKENVKAALSAVAERKKEKVPAVPAVAAAAAADVANVQVEEVVRESAEIARRRREREEVRDARGALCCAALARSCAEQWVWWASAAREGGEAAAHHGDPDHGARRFCARQAAQRGARCRAA